MKQQTSASKLAIHQTDLVKDVGFIQRSVVQEDDFDKRWLKFVTDPLRQISSEIILFLCE